MDDEQEDLYEMITMSSHEKMNQKDQMKIKGIKRERIIKIYEMKI